MRLLVFKHEAAAATDATAGMRLLVCKHGAAGVQTPGCWCASMRLLVCKHEPWCARMRLLLLKHKAAGVQP